MTGRSAAPPRPEERASLTAVTGRLVGEWRAGGGAHGASGQGAETSAAGRKLVRRFPKYLRSTPRFKSLQIQNGRLNHGLGEVLGEKI